jgi:prepilin-type N-terminal cleavage/methylation domain-containing protein
MKHAKEEQLNNGGFSLVELLIAIVILSIIVVPLLHSFVTSARTNAKSRNTMHATAIAEDVMEQFEAHTLGEMADTYEAASVEGFTNTVKRGEDIDSDGDLEWVYTFRDSSTTSGAYDVVTTLDPSAYTTINEKDLIDIQNLAGNLNAVYSEKADSDIGAYLYFSNYATNTALENIPKYVKKIVEITIDTNRISLDLGDGETLETDAYLVTALTRYHCDTSIFNNPSLSGDYPQNGTDYVIFSNEDAVRRQAAQIKAQKEAGAAVQSKVISDLANIVLCDHGNSGDGRKCYCLCKFHIRKLDSQICLDHRDIPCIIRISNFQIAKGQTICIQLQISLRNSTPGRISFLLLNEITGSILIDTISICSSDSLKHCVLCQRCISTDIVIQLGQIIYRSIIRLIIFLHTT